jgi:Uri superfamily endonuclease
MILIPSTPGTYALYLYLSSQDTLQVGKLGTFSFPAGTYIYTGSAFGPGGLRARLNRHLNARKRRFWHIDYLLSSVNIFGVYYLESEHRYECLWSQALATQTDVYLPAPGFGSSDCGICITHLTAFPAGKLLQKIVRDNDYHVDLFKDILKQTIMGTSENIYFLPVSDS